jgi:hypothetical protein
MTPPLKLMRVFTILRSDADPDKVRLERYDEILETPNTPEGERARAEFIHTFHLLLSGELKVSLDDSELTFNGKVIKL